jgi:hypothetical protein
MSLYFGDLSWPELERAIEKNTLIILPVGTTEEHGRHLPVETDAIIASEIASHGHHQGLLKTVSREIFDRYDIAVAITSPAGFSKEIFRKIRKTQTGGSIHRDV